MYAMRNKIKDWGVYLRTRSGLGVGRSRRGRQHPAYLQAVCNGENQEGSSDGGEGQASKIVFLGIEEITDATSVRKTIKVEKEDEWSNCIKGDRMMTAMTPKQVESALMTMSRKYADLNNKYGSIADLVRRTADIAGLKVQCQIGNNFVIAVLAAFAEAKTTIRPELTENYDDMILWTLAMQGLYNEKEDGGLPRVEQTLSEVLKQVDKNMGDALK